MTLSCDPQLWHRPSAVAPVLLFESGMHENFAAGFVVISRVLPLPG